MNQRSLEVLEYPKIVSRLSSFCVTSAAKEMALNLQPMTNRTQVEENLDLTSEALAMILRNGRAPLAPLGNIEDLVHRSLIGSMLSMSELLSIAEALRTAKNMQDYYDEDTGKDELSALKPLFDSLDPCYSLEEDIRKKILSSEEMADTASRELAHIRKEIISKNASITEKLNKIISSPSNDKVLQEKIITIRNNRYVVPVKQEYRNVIPGIVLDKSSSGATIFIEPMSVVELNNELKLLAAEEEKEIVRILKELTDRVAAYQLPLISNTKILTELDFCFAKGSYGIEINGVRVQLSEDREICYYHARHPLLDPKIAVASDIIKSNDIYSIVITGPNTGGKTVTLKTIGLLNLMVQSGLFVPVREKSHTCLFSDIYADIGDEQSIEQSLSTFSAHMKNIVEIINQADENSLALFDELGAGTDPVEGAALAVAVLNNLYQRKVTTVATTHYSELKEYALVTPGIQNASVEFDVKTLQPTFKLLMGIPGKSNAFEIAERLGLPKYIIDDAKNNIETESMKFEETLDQIDEKRKEYEKSLKEVQSEKESLEAEKKAIEQENEAVKKRCRLMIEEARKQSDQIVLDTQKKTEAIYQEIRRIQEHTESGVKDNKKLEALRKGIKDQSDKIENRYQAMARQYQKKHKKPKKLTPGMTVFVENLNKNGEIINISDRDNQATVQIGPMKIKVPKSHLIPTKEEPKKSRDTKKHQMQIKESDRHVMNKRLDLRGRSAEEGVYMVEKFLSDAVISGTHELEILHGKGTGKLRKAIHDYLDSSPLIEDYRDGAPNEGGTGVTIIKI